MKYYEHIGEQIRRIMVYAVYTPSTDASTRPSVCYSYMGELTREEKASLEQELLGTLCSLHAFESPKEFDYAMEDMDEQHYSFRC